MNKAAICDFVDNLDETSRVYHFLVVVAALLIFVSLFIQSQITTQNTPLHATETAPAQKIEFAQGALDVSFDQNIYYKENNLK